MYAVECSNVLKRYMQEDHMQLVFNQLNLQINENEVVLIKGKKGSGKRTLLNMIAGFTPPNAGDIRIFGTNAVSLNNRKRWRQSNIGIVEDVPGNHIFEDITVNQMFTCLNEYVHVQYDNNEIQQKMTDLFLLLNIDFKQKHTKYSQLHCLTQLKVRIAIELFKEPRLLLIYEPLPGRVTDTEAKQFKAIFDCIMAFYPLTVIVFSESSKLEPCVQRSLMIHKASIYEGSLPNLA